MPCFLTTGVAGKLGFGSGSVLSEHTLLTYLQDIENLLTEVH